MIRLMAVCGLALMVLSTGAGGAWAEFDCKTFVEGSGLASGAGVSQVKIRPEDEAHHFSDRRDGVKLLEIYEQFPPSIAEVAFTRKYENLVEVECILLLSEFRESYTDKQLVLEHPKDASTGRFVPILVLHAGKNGESQKKATLWEKNKYNIPIKLETGSSGLETFVPLSDISFSVNTKVNVNAPVANQVRFLRRGDMTGEAFEALGQNMRPGYDSNSPVMIVLCYPVGCDMLAMAVTGEPDTRSDLTNVTSHQLGASAGTEGTTSLAGSATTGGDTGMLGGIGRSTTVNGTSIGGDATGTSAEERTKVAVGAAQDSSIAIATAARRRPWPVMRFERTKNGQTNLYVPELEFDPACVVYALAPEMFESPPQCSGANDVELVKGLQAGNPKVRVGTDGSWDILDTRPEMPERVEFLLPPTTDTVRCKASMTYLDAYGVSRTLQAEVRDGLMRFSLVDDAKFEDFSWRATLVPEDGTGCGFDGQEAVLDAKGEVVIRDLAAGVPTLVSLAYLLVPNDSQLEDPGGRRLGDNSRPLLSQDLVQAVSSAHEQALQSLDGTAWRLDGASVWSLGQTGEATERMRLDASNLRDQPGERLGDAVGRAVSSERLTTLNAAGLERALLKIVESYPLKNEVVIAMLAPGVRRVGDAAPDPCRQSTFTEAARRLSLATGGRAVLRVYPMVRWPAEASLPLEDFILDRVNPNLPRLPSETATCRGTGAALTVVPFFFEGWRSTDAVLKRYTIALSDHLGGLVVSLAQSGRTR